MEIRMSPLFIMARIHLLTFLLAAAILWLTLAPHPLGDDPIQLQIPYADKIVHFIMFFSFDFALLFEYRLLRRLSPLKMADITIATIIFGGAIEIAQDAMGLGRGADLADLAADSTGALAATLLFPVICRSVISRGYRHFSNFKFHRHHGK